MKYDLQKQYYGIKKTPQSVKKRIESKWISDFVGVDKVLKIYVHARKLAVSHLNRAVSRICVNGESSKQTRERIWICLALLSPDYAKIWCSASWGIQACSPEHGDTKITAPLGKKPCKLAVGSFWPLCTNTSVTLWGQKRSEVVGSPPDSPHTSPGGCQSLKAAAKHFSWDKQAFFPLKGCCSPYSHLAVFLWQLLVPGAEALAVLISSSPTGSQMGDSETPGSYTGWDIKGSDTIQSHIQH